MLTLKYKVAAIFALLVLFASCLDLEDVNVNPNGVDPAKANPNLLVATITTSSGLQMVNLGFGNLAGVMQHTQLDGWGGAHDAYDWSDQSWSSYYGTLRSVDELLNKAKNQKLEFHQGVALVIKAFNYGLIADLWGDAPFSRALMGEQGGDNLKPDFDNQKDIYVGILAMLDEANTLLSKNQSEYSEINSTQDILYAGNVAKWRKFSNSLALRYYLRISSKEPELAKTGIEKITSDPAKYPLITNASDDACFPFVGTSTTDSWPSTTRFSTNKSGFTRIKMCSVLVDKMQTLSDPRLGIWAAKVQIPLVIDPSRAGNFDQIVDGKRVIGQGVADAYFTKYNTSLDTDPEYVGLPPAWSNFMQLYNLNPPKEQGEPNPHASQLNDIYQESSGPHLKARMLSAAEVNFSLAEIALKGWNAGNTAEYFYKEGVKASLTAWGLASSYSSYIAKAGVTYNGTLAQVMEQKWIASWTAASESWFDYRRTGLPNLKAGPAAKRAALPVRFIYGQNELLYNPDKAKHAIDKLESTTYNSTDGANSAWSKPWLLQGTSKPW